MAASDILGVLAGGFGVVMAASPVLQARRVHLMRRSEDVSVPFLAIFWIGTLLWLAYGISIANVAITVANSVGAICGAATISVVLYWRRNGE
jgi:uncharacterized protein with PQ loop repeat